MIVAYFSFSAEIQAWEHDANPIHVCYVLKIYFFLSFLFDL